MIWLPFHRRTPSSTSSCCPLTGARNIHTAATCHHMHAHSSSSTAASRPGAPHGLPRQQAGRRQPSTSRHGRRPIRSLPKRSTPRSTSQTTKAVSTIPKNITGIYLQTNAAHAFLGSHTSPRTDCCAAYLGAAMVTAGTFIPSAVSSFSPSMSTLESVSGTYRLP